VASRWDGGRDDANAVPIAYVWGELFMPDTLGISSTMSDAVARTFGQSLFTYLQQALPAMRL
jgi:hypothetical protein